jgi:hypothetical protein
MTKQTFESMIRKLRASYEKKPPDTEIMSYWYQEAGVTIPEEAAPWITSWVKDQHRDRWPNHFQDVLANGYQAWLAANPQKRAMSSEPECHQPNCGRGLYFVQKFEEQFGYWAGYALPCVCGRSKLGGVPRWTWEQVVRAGYRIAEPIKPALYSVSDHGTVDAVKRTADRSAA